MSKAGPVTFHYIEPNSEEWIMHRMYYKNASEAPIAAGVAPSWFSINSPRKLYEFKQGIWQPKEDNFSARNHAHGHNMEAVALAAFERRLSEELGVELKMEPVIVSRVVDGLQLSASLDGYVELPDGRKIGAEVKCPASGERSKTWRAMLDNEIQEYHQWQMDQQFICADLDELYFVAYVEEEQWDAIRYHGEERDRIIPMWKDFDENPPAAEVLDMPAELEPTVRAYLTAKQAKADAEKAMAVAKNTLTQHAAKAGASLKGFGVAVSQKTKKGNIKYDKVPELKGVDLEPYRGASSTYWEVREQESSDE